MTTPSELEAAMEHLVGIAEEWEAAAGDMGLTIAGQHANAIRTVLSALAASEARRVGLEGALVIYQRLRCMIPLIGDDENAKGYNEALELFATVDQQATALLNPQQEGSRDHG